MYCAAVACGNSCPLACADHDGHSAGGLLLANSTSTGNMHSSACPCLSVRTTNHHHHHHYLMWLSSTHPHYPICSLPLLLIPSLPAAAAAANPLQPTTDWVLPRLCCHPHQDTQAAARDTPHHGLPHVPVCTRLCGRPDGARTPLGVPGTCADHAHLLWVSPV